MGECEAHEQSATTKTDHPPNDLTDQRTDMIQNAPITEMAVDSPTTKTPKTCKDVKSTSVKVKSTTPSVKSTSVQENLASNPASLLAAIGDSEEYVKPIVKDGEIILEVECGQNKAYLYLSKLCQGSKGPCIFFQTSWLTPNEFQFVSGRETAKDWKRSIRHHGKSLKLLLTKGILSVHPTVCDCEGCRHGSSTPTRCRTGEKRKTPSTQERKVKKSSGSVEHHANGAFKPVDRCRPTEGAKPASGADGKLPQDQNFPCSSGKKTTEKHCSPLKESKLTNVIDAPKIQQCERLIEQEDQSLKKVKVQGQINIDSMITVPKIPVVEDVPEVVSLPPTEIRAPVPPVKEIIKIDEQPPKCEQRVELPEVKYTEPLSKPLPPEVKVEVKVKVETKPIETCPEPCVNDISCSDINVTESVCVTDSVEVPIRVESEKAETLARSATPVPMEANDVNNSSDAQPSSPCSSSCPSSPEPTGDSEICQRTLPMCPKNSKSHSVKAAERHVVEHASVSSSHVKEPEKCKESAKPKTHVTHETKHKVTDEPIPKNSRRELEKASPRSIQDSRTTNEVAQVRQPETGDAAFSDYMRLLAAGHGPQMLHQPPAGMEPMYDIRPPQIHVNPAMLHPLHACSMYSHPGMVQKEPVLYPTTAGALPPNIGAPCFAPMHMMQPRMQYAVPQPPMVDMSRSLQYLPIPGSVPYHCGTMGGLKRGSVEMETASALDLSTSKRLRLEYPTPDYRFDTLPGCHGFQPYGYDYSRNLSEELSRKMYAEESFKPTGSIDFKPYTPSWMDHAGKSVLHRCTCAESRPGDIRFWSVEDVCRFISMLDGCSLYAENFREQRVDGKILPLLTTDHLMKNLGMKLGPALLVSEAVAKKVQEASKYPGCDSCRKLILGAS
ncbi:uncharacterized protein LOC124131036 [Haliotis rufescens]|uniref:uncharacterized protein LOC124131036 n=1 Tax=Haliotis rufescens TaxID=6454 RepID=UPI00201F1F01|nr:uncharacterized protein LOC124131036 [Haliotis rufescens]